MPWLPWYFKPAQVFSGVHTLSYLSDGKCWLLRRMVLQSMGSLVFVGVVACDMRQIRFVWLGVLVKQTGVRMWLRACRGGASGFARILRGSSFGACLVAVSIGSAGWPQPGVAHYVYLAIDANIRLSCDIQPINIIIWAAFLISGCIVRATAR